MSYPTNGSSTTVRSGMFDIPLTVRVQATTPEIAREIAQSAVTAIGQGDLGYYGVSSVAVAGEPVPYVPTTVVTVTFANVSPDDERSIRSLLESYASYLPASARSPKIEAVTV